MDENTNSLPKTESCFQYSRREFLKTGAAALGTFAFAGLPRAEAEMRQPNLLVLYTDQQSLWTIGAYGGKVVETPHIDRIASEGAIFKNFITNSAVCTPSRGCFFTGRYPHAHGAYSNNIELNRDEVTLAHVLANAGYDTGYAGKWHLDGESRPGWMKKDRSMGFKDCRYMFNRGHWKKIIDRGDLDPQVEPYEVIGDEKTYTTDWLADKTIDFIRRKRDKPFFFVASFPDPHDPYAARAPYSEMFPPEKMPLPETFFESNASKPDWANEASAHFFKPGADAANERSLRKSMSEYCGAVKCIDDNIGRILSCLKELDILDNTLIVFTSDHGDFMGEHGLMHKTLPYDAAFHVPMIISYPGKIRSGSAVDEMMSTVDFQPTILSLLGVKRCGREQGADLSGILLGSKNGGAPDEAYIYHANQIMAGIYTKTHVLAYTKGKNAILFDRQADPLQKRNLFTDKKMKPLIDELTGRITVHLEKTGSPEAGWIKERGLRANNS